MTSFHPPLSFSKAPGPEAAADASCVLVGEDDNEEEGCGCCCWRFQRGEHEAVGGEGGRMTKAIILKEGGKADTSRNEHERRIRVRMSISEGWESTQVLECKGRVRPERPWKATISRSFLPPLPARHRKWKDTANGAHMQGMRTDMKPNNTL